METTPLQGQQPSASESAIQKDRRLHEFIPKIDLRKPAISPELIMAMLESESANAQGGDVDTNARAMIELKKLHFSKYFDYGEIKSIFEKKEGVENIHLGSGEKESEFIGKMREIFDKKMNSAKSSKDVYRLQLHKEYFEKTVERVGSWKDELTGLYSRTGLLEVIKLITNCPQAIYQDADGKSIEAGDLKNTGVAVLMLDMDKFKKINDNFGHSEGDKALSAFAVALTEENVLRKTDLVVRLGGDEFLIITFNADPDQIHEVNKKIKDRIKKVAIGNGDHILDFSLGSDPNKTWSELVQYAESGDLGNLINDADKAVYVSKDEGGGKMTMVKS